MRLQRQAPERQRQGMYFRIFTMTPSLSLWADVVTPLQNMPLHGNARLYPAYGYNPPHLPDLAWRVSQTKRSGQPAIGMVSLGCPKAVDSERILTRLRAEGYGISPDYAGAMQ